MRASISKFYLQNHRLAKRATLAAGLALALGAGVSAPVQAGLIINADTTDPSVTGPAKTDINAAVTLFQTQFAATRNLNVSIQFKMGDLGAGGLGTSNSTTYSFTYGQYTGALGTAATNIGNPIEVSAVNNLGSGNGSGGTGRVQTTSADARMLSADGANLNALCAGGTCSGNTNGTFDGLITLNNRAGVLDFNRGDGFTTGTWDAMRTIEHEIDEVLAIGGPGSQLPGNTNPNGTIGDEYLFRYSGKGTPSLTTNPTATAFFSFDGGANKVANFNQGFNNAARGNCLTNAPQNCGDFADWANTVANTGPDGCGSGLVQDAFACPKQIADIGLASAEGMALQAIGYDPVPEPGTLALLVTSLLGFAALRRRRRQ